MKLGRRNLEILESPCNHLTPRDNSVKVDITGCIFDVYWIHSSIKKAVA